MRYAFVDETGTSNWDRDNKAARPNWAIVSTMEPFSVSAELRTAWLRVNADLQDVRQIFLHLRDLAPSWADKKTIASLDQADDAFEKAIDDEELHTRLVFGALESIEARIEPHERNAFWHLVAPAGDWVLAPHNLSYFEFYGGSTRLSTSLLRYLLNGYLPKNPNPRFVAIKRSLDTASQQYTTRNLSFDGRAKIGALLDCYAAQIRRGLVDILKLVMSKCEVGIVSMDQANHPGLTIDKVAELAIGTGIEWHGRAHGGPLTVCVDALKTGSAVKLMERWQKNGAGVSALLPVNSSGTPLIWGADLVAFVSNMRSDLAFERQLRDLLRQRPDCWLRIAE